MSLVFLKEIMMRYYVVLEGTGEEKSNYKGVRTIRSLKSKEDFDRWKEKGGNKDIVIAENISEDEAIRELVKCSGTQFDPKIVKYFMKALKRNNKVQKGFLLIK